MKFRAMIATVAALAGLTACSSGTDTGVPNYGDNSVDTAAYNDAPMAPGLPADVVISEKTTCGQWLNRTSAEARAEAAHRMGNAAGAYDHSHAFAVRFASNISKVCRSSPANLRITDVAAGLATLDTADFRP